MLDYFDAEVGAKQNDIKRLEVNMSKKKILLLSDDLRMSSGVGTMSKEFVLEQYIITIGFKLVVQLNILKMVNV